MLYRSIKNITLCRTVKHNKVHNKQDFFVSANEFMRKKNNQMCQTFLKNHLYSVSTSLKKFLNTSLKKILSNLIQLWIHFMGGTFPATVWCQDSGFFQEAMRTVSTDILSVIFHFSGCRFWPCVTQALLISVCIQTCTSCKIWLANPSWQFTVHMSRLTYNFLS